MTVIDGKVIEDMDIHVFTVDTRPIQWEVKYTPEDDGRHWHHNSETFHLMAGAWEMAW